MIPVQVQRLVLVSILVVAAFFIVRSQLVPLSFGARGHYRADSVDEIAALPIKFAGEEACTTCHAGVDEIRVTAPHAGVRCESCHGPSKQHSLDPVANPKPHLENATALCLGCHEYNPTRPPDFPQIDRREHRPGIECVACHNPHSLEKTGEAAKIKAGVKS